MNRWCGLDIGGANLKICVGESVRSESLPLWKSPAQLYERLRRVFVDLQPSVGIAVTMTGELADCFENRQEGVEYIADAVVNCAGSRLVRFRSTQGEWLSSDSAKLKWEEVAAANWHVSASYLSRFLVKQSGFMIDLGSTTMDVIPIKGDAVAGGLQDMDRLANGQLCYAGIQRTPVCSICNELTISGQSYQICREFFATVGDALLVLGELPESKTDRLTSDGRPATRAFAAQRLARMVGSDAAVLGMDAVNEMANQIKDSLGLVLVDSIDSVVLANPDLAKDFLLCGEGEFLVDDLLNQRSACSGSEVKKVSTLLGQNISTGMAAYAVAQLAGEELSLQQGGESATRLEPKERDHNSQLCRVIKVGGSLFELPSLREEIESWLAKQTPARDVLLVGGGPMVDEVRRFQKTHGLSDSSAHWAAIGQLGNNCRLFQNLFPKWPLVTSILDLSRCREDRVIFDPSPWLRESDLLEHSWNSTSDSCAAMLAKEIGADEIVLMKSRLPHQGEDVRQPDQELVDVQFSSIAGGIPSKIVNLRDPSHAEVELMDGSASA